MTPAELEAQERREMFIQDQSGMIEKADTDGAARGKHEQSVAIAKNLHAIGLSREQIASATGLNLASLHQVLGALGD